MKALKQFIFYNNTIPIVLGVLFLGAGATFAASPEARDAVITAEVAVTTVDNSYLLETAITDDTVRITIGSVTENETDYFIEYQMTTIESRDGAWQPVTKTKTLVVTKESVVSRDLGLYAEEELAEVHAAEVRRLKQVQEVERQAGLTPKVVTTEYGGLVGQFFDPNQEVFPEYNPIIDPSIGIPLTSEQEKAHKAVRRLIEEERKREESEAQPRSTPATDELQQDPDGDSGGGGPADGGELPPIETPSTDSEPPAEEGPPGEPTPEAESPAPEPEPVLEPESESPPTLESIGL
jgi:hypothetical protein